MQSDQEEEVRSRTPLEDELLRRQQKRLEVTNSLKIIFNTTSPDKHDLTPAVLLFDQQKEREENVQEEAQLMEFVRVRQNLRKIRSAIQNKAANSEQFPQNVQ